MRNKKRRSKKVQNIIDTLIFYLITCLSIGGLVLYLWVYTEIDDSLYALDIQRKRFHWLKKILCASNLTHGKDMSHW